MDFDVCRSHNMGFSPFLRGKFRDVGLVLIHLQNSKDHFNALRDRIVITTAMIYSFLEITKKAESSHEL